jgi:hypothetical protein
MTQATREKIEKVRTEFGMNFFTAKQLKQFLGSDFMKTLLRNVPTIEKEVETIEIEISEVEYNEFMEKYGLTMDCVHFGGVGYSYEKDGKFYNKRSEAKYRFTE